MKRRLNKFVVFLLLGAIVNVAVAWGCALTRIRPERVFSPVESVSLNFYLTYLPDVRGSGGRTPPYVWGDVCLGFDSRSVSWSSSRYSGASLEIDAGWPARSMTGGMWERWTGGPLTGINFVLLKRSYVDSIVVGAEEKLIEFGSPRLLPLRPELTGFAVNTIFYAVILWLLTLGPFTARRMIRRKRWRCINCGYDLRGDFSAGCSECGWQREDEA